MRMTGNVALMGGREISTDYLWESQKERDH
jgi:hypothetical protein